MDAPRNIQTRSSDGVLVSSLALSSVGYGLAEVTPGCVNGEIDRRAQKNVQYLNRKDGL